MDDFAHKQAQYGSSPIRIIKYGNEFDKSRYEKFNFTFGIGRFQNIRKEETDTIRKILIDLGLRTSKDFDDELTSKKIMMI